jgi:wyosine [tRNA(Phe)-imidazoG37] synthetase (radical SAM superfamily)
MFLWDSIVFGPIFSRRLGKSLGVNLLPTTEKICSFNCVYCECGWTPDKEMLHREYLPAETILSAVEAKLKNCEEENVTIDSITFSGNGEPTMHPDFGKIISELIPLRNQYYPKTAITCLSNSTQLFRQDVKEALQKIENPILKLDAGSETFFKLVDKPVIPVTLQEIINQLKSFQGNLIIQTMILRGEVDNQYFDNSSGEELSKLLHHIKVINPQKVMLYSLDRKTPAKNLFKIEQTDLKHISEKIQKMAIAAEIY